MYENSITDIKKASLGDNEAMTKLIEDNQGLIWSIVKRFCGRGYEAEDLYQIGCMGFIKSIKRFDTSYDVKLSTYAVPYILGEIKKFLRDDGIIKVSRSIKELNMKISKLEEEHLRKTGENITIKELEEKLKIDKEEIAVALEARNPVESIYKEEGKSDDENNIKLINKIPASENEENDIINRITVSQLIEGLKSQEKQIILLRFYKNKTQTEVGKILGISQVQVSRIEKKVLDRMRISLEAV